MTPTDLPRPDPDAYVAGIVHPRRRADAERVLAVLREATGVEPRMWGSSIVGFGSYRYRYDSGHEGETMRVGFAPRTTALVFYGLQGRARSAELLEQLGKHKPGAGCVYVKKLDDIDVDVLRELAADAFRERHPSEV